ncbi:hypothetical protein CAOG_05090 [Capsaspora owczarzaki ATCC 30864]|uniref:FYVE-type domain-containing protein n=1 Tax=Capsaspora owczarzaki (strain ATCC 30864) TaxID=595528 RepID=A0A0D2VT96_CAPO3|nr:hypothetical protein CAOG_05090 [Capsaspora owczarzaki ATCC 30864]KJE94452.1 hypothetical protein CAOG_005090 [Capsaspora owczarzaki ATCC 30864]|eukprot:XP_004346775.1 hypothetical protein CAOG_05090 [Capsaspora owczarzaki ATCC 30864]
MSRGVVAMAWRPPQDDAVDLMLASGHFTPPPPSQPGRSHSHSLNNPAVSGTQSQNQSQSRTASMSSLPSSDRAAVRSGDSATTPVSFSSSSYAAAAADVASSGSVTDRVLAAMQRDRSETTTTPTPDPQLAHDEGSSSSSSSTGRGSNSHSNSNNHTGNVNVAGLPFQRPLWLGDGALSCLRCGQPFSLGRRRHHCRQCGRVLCHTCCTTKLPLPLLNYSEPERVCDDCVPVAKLVSAALAASLSPAPNSASILEDNAGRESGSESVRQLVRVARTLSELSARDDWFARVVSQGGILALARLCRSSSTEVQFFATEGLFHITKRPSAHASLARLGVCRTLLALIGRTASDSALLNVLRNLCILSKTEETRILLLQDNIIHAALYLSTSSIVSDAVQTLAGRCLSILVSFEAGQSAIVADRKGALRSLQSLLLSPNEIVQKYAAKSIAFITMHSERARARVLNEDMTMGGALVSVLCVCPNLHTISHCACAVANLASTLESQLIIPPEMITALCILAVEHSSVVEMQCHVARGLANFALFERNHDTILDVISQVFQLFSVPSDEIHRHVLRAIENLLTKASSASATSKARKVLLQRSDTMAHIRQLAGVANSTSPTEAVDNELDSYLAPEATRERARGVLVLLGELPSPTAADSTLPVVPSLALTPIDKSTSVTSTHSIPTGSLTTSNSTAMPSLLANSHSAAASPVTVVVATSALAVAHSFQSLSTNAAGSEPAVTHTKHQFTTTTSHEQYLAQLDLAHQSASLDTIMSAMQSQQRQHPFSDVPSLRQQIEAVQAHNLRADSSLAVSKSSAAGFQYMTKPASDSSLAPAGSTEDSHGRTASTTSLHSLQGALVDPPMAPTAHLSSSPNNYAASHAATRTRTRTRTMDTTGPPSFGSPVNSSGRPSPAFHPGELSPGFVAAVSHTGVDALVTLRARYQERLDKLLLQQQSHVHADMSDSMDKDVDRLHAKIAQLTLDIEAHQPGDGIITP